MITKGSNSPITLTSGDVQIMSDGILITGDGTITMSGKGK